MSKINKSERFEMRTSSDFYELLDEWRKQQDAIPSRAESVRELTVRALFIFWAKIFNEAILDGYENVNEYEFLKSKEELEKLADFCKKNKIDMDLEFKDLAAGYGVDIRIPELKENDKQ